MQNNASEHPGAGRTPNRPETAAGAAADGCFAPDPARFTTPYGHRDGGGGRHGRAVGHGRVAVIAWLSYSTVAVGGQAGS